MGTCSCSRCSNHREQECINESGTSWQLRIRSQVATPKKLKSRRVHFYKLKCQLSKNPILIPTPIDMLNVLEGQLSSTASLSPEVIEDVETEVHSDEQKIIRMSSRKSYEDLGECLPCGERPTKVIISIDPLIVPGCANVEDDSLSYSSSGSFNLENSNQAICSDLMDVCSRDDANNEEFKPETHDHSPSSEKVYNDWLSIDLEDGRPLSTSIHKCKLKENDDDYKETVRLTKENKKVTRPLSNRRPLSVRRKLRTAKSRPSLLKKKRKLVDAYVDAIPSSRRQLTMLTIAIDSIWKDVTRVEKGKLTLLEREYKRELAWLKSRKGEQKRANKSQHLEQSMRAAKDTIHAYSGVLDVCSDNSPKARVPKAREDNVPEVELNQNEERKF